MNALLTFALVASMYTDTGDLFCGGTTSTVRDPIVAFPISRHGIDWECWDLVLLRFPDGTSIMTRVTDAGPFGDNCVTMGDNCVPIAVDVHVSSWPFGERLSMGVEVHNFGQMAREAGVERVVH